MTLDETLDRIDEQITAAKAKMERMADEVARLTTERLVAVGQRDRAVRILKEIEDYCNEECDGAPDSKDPLLFVWRLTQHFACGEVPAESSHARCKEAERRMRERAVQAEECERVLRAALHDVTTELRQWVKEYGHPSEVSDVMEEARSALLMPGRHAGPYLAEVKHAG